VSAPGFKTAKRSLHVGGSDRQQVEIALERASAGEPMGTGPAVVDQPSTTAKLRATDTTQPTETSRPPTQPVTTPALSPTEPVRDLRRKIAWTLAIASAAVAAGAVVETVVWQRRRNEFNTSQGCYEDQPNRGGPGCDSLFDDVHRAQLASIVGYVLTGGLAIGSAALFMSGRTPEPRPTSTLACWGGVSRLAFNCRVSF
jgi:hypothetical protein